MAISENWCPFGMQFISNVSLLAPDSGELPKALNVRVTDHWMSTAQIRENIALRVSTQICNRITGTHDCEQTSTYTTRPLCTYYNRFNWEIEWYFFMFIDENRFCFHHASDGHYCACDLDLGSNIFNTTFSHDTQAQFLVSGVRSYANLTHI